MNNDLIDQICPTRKSDKFDFAEQMVVGDLGEKGFIQCYPELSPRKSKDLAWDFNLNTGKTVELKTDDYPMSKTPNFFMETVSDTKTGKLGGPSRAYQDGVSFFVYYFIQDRVFFWFETARLHEYLQNLLKTHPLPLKTIQNKKWSSEGYAVPRRLLEPVLLRKDLFA